MPESRNRRKKTSQQSNADDIKVQANWAEGIKLSPTWWAPVMVTFMIIGLIWIVVYYLSSAHYPIPGIGNWNLAIGLIIAMVGFLMTLRWR